jgi:hypothetical protein
MVDDKLQFTTVAPPDDPVTFSIDSETFTGRSALPGHVYLSISRKLTDGAGIVRTGIIEDFFALIMEEEEHARFRTFIEAPDRYVSAELLGEIFLSLFTRYATGPQESPTRPTKPPKPSRSGRAKTQTGSKDNSSSGA